MNFINNILKRPTLMIPILICLIGSTTAAISIAILFQVAMEGEKARLSQMVSSQARLMESVAKFDIQHSEINHPEGGFGAALEQISMAHKSLNGFGETGEFVIGKLIDGQVAVLQPQKFNNEVNFLIPQYVPIPMQRALSGKTGGIIGTDYKGHEVLAAYEPVSILNIGLVAKIDTAEIYRPFIISGLIAAFFSAVMLVFGVFAARYFAAPFAEKDAALEQLSKSQLELAKAQEMAGLGSWTWNIADNSVQWSDEHFRIIGYQPGEVTPTLELFIDAIHPQDIQRFSYMVDDTLNNDSSFDTEFRIIDTKGTTRNIRAYGEVVRDGDAKAVSMIGTVMDITERHDIENQLRFSEQRFRDISTSSSDWFWETDVDHRLTFVSERGPELLGFGTSDVIGKTRWEVGNHNIDDEHWTLHLQDLNKHELFRDFEYTLHREAGAEIIISVNGIPIFDDAGEFSGYRGTARNVTTRRMAELSLRVSEERFTKSQKFANIGTWDWNVKTGELYWSDRIAALFGYQEGELETTYDNFVGAIHPDDRKKVTDAVMACVEKGVEYNIEHRVVWPNGAVRYLLEKGDVVRDKDGAPVNMLGVVQDITDSKESHQEIQRLGRRNQLILDAAGDGIYGIDLDGLCTFINPAAAQMVGYCVEELIGTSQHEVLHHSKADGSYYPRTASPIYASFIDGKVRYVDDEVFWHKDGTSIPVEYTSTPIFENHETVGAVVVFRDVSERKEMQQQLIQSSKMATLGEMATGVAHELNQPLNIIRMAVNNVQRKSEKNEADPQYLSDKLKKIDAQVDRASAIIEHMRIFGRKPGATMVSLEPKDMIESTLGLIGEQLRLADIDVVCEMSDDCIPVLGHQVQMEQVLLNLIGNARDSMADIENSKKRILTSVDSTEEFVTIAVEDTGGGIDEKDLPRIFEPFYTTKEVGQGTGLGLSISYGIISEMGGTITASNADEGARFVISLPRIRQDASQFS